jgi:hypothetical protein
MQGIQALITNLFQSAQTLILPALLIGSISIGGYMGMTGDWRGARTWITGGLFGAAIVLSATAIAALVQGVHG